MCDVMFKHMYTYVCVYIYIYIYCLCVCLYLSPPGRREASGSTNKMIINIKP